MKKEEAILWYGSQTKLAEFLGVYQSNVCGWKKIPQHHQRNIEKDTNGELVADMEMTHRRRFQCFMELGDFLIMSKHAKRQSISVGQFLRRAVREYITTHKLKD
jgi:DNA-binding transcriptional regulator YdaS (Cro superfamily)